MKIELCLDAQELKGRQAAKFEVRDGDGSNIGTLIVGKGGIRWQEPKASVNAKSRSWNQVITWLRGSERTVRK